MPLSPDLLNPGDLSEIGRAIQKLSIYSWLHVVTVSTQHESLPVGHVQFRFKDLRAYSDSPGRGWNLDKMVYVSVGEYYLVFSDYERFTRSRDPGNCRMLVAQEVNKGHLKPAYSWPDILMPK